MTSTVTSQDIIHSVSSFNQVPSVCPALPSLSLNNLVGIIHRRRKIFLSMGAQLNENNIGDVGLFMFCSDVNWNELFKLDLDF